MPEPILNVSLEEIKLEVVRLIGWLESASDKHPSWTWPSSMLVIAHEFQTLATQHPLNVVRINDLTIRLKQHIASQRLKGFDDFVWYAEAFERLAKKDRDTGPTVR